MNIIVVGCGKIGTILIESLSAEGHDITAIDNDPAVIKEITNIYDIMGVCGSGTDCSVLEEAGVEKARLIIAATGSDEFNMLSCFIAKKMGARHSIARIRDPQYNQNSLGFLRENLNLSMALNPDLLTAQELFNILKLPGAVKVETFSRRNFEMIELVIKSGSILCGMTLSNLRGKFTSRFLVCVVCRGEDVYIPDGNFELREGDRIGISADIAELHKFLKESSITQKQARKVVILGGSKISYYLAKALTEGGTSVKIIEKNLEKCEQFSEKLPKAVIIHGDGTEQELLLEEGIESADAFVALTNLDEQNILISIFASNHNVPKTIAKVNRKALISMSDKLGLDTVVSPKSITSDVVVSYARALENTEGSTIETLYNLFDGKAEALEFKVTTESKATNIPLKDLKTKPNTLIAGIIRGRRAITPTGDDCILPSDRVIIITSGNRLSDITDILD